MNPAFIIAKDSVQSLLRQRLLVAIMLASFGITLLFSSSFAKSRSLVEQAASFEAEMEAAEEGGEPVEETTTEATDRVDEPVADAADGDAQTEGLTAEQERQLADSLEQLGLYFMAMFYGVVSFSGTIVALLIFSGAIASEIRNGTIRVTLAKPVSKTQWLLGRYLGGVAVMAVYSLITALGLFVFAQSQDLTFAAALKYGPWLMFCKHLIVGSIAMLLSLWMHPALAAVLAFFCGAEPFRGLMPVPLYIMLPSYGSYNIFGHLIRGHLFSVQDVVMLSLYALNVIIIMLALAHRRFRTMDLV
jgi:ABC-type transport system involved in multi-copper enzyme maturation permease subunit